MSSNKLCGRVKSSFKQGYAHLGHVSNCHGVVDFYKSDQRFNKIFWGIALLSAFSAIIYYFVVITQQYIDNPTATKITEIAVEELEFPNVTVCKYEKLSVKHFMEKWAILQPVFTQVFGTTSDPLEFGGWVLGVEGPTYIDYDTSEANIRLMEGQFQVAFNQSLATGLRWDVQDFLRETATQCSELFSSCMFSAKTFNCCTRTYPVFTIYGVCYHMTPSPREVKRETVPLQAVAGSKGGLQLALIHNSTDTPIFPRDDSTQNGFFITIAPYFSMFESDTVSIQPGTVAYVSISPVYRILNPTKNRCTKTSKPIGPMINNIYSYRLCQSQCYFNASMQRYGCYVLGSYMNVSSADLCTPYGAQRAIAEVVDAGNPESDVKLMYCTNNNCSQNCEYWSYPPSVTQSSMVPTPKYLSVTQNEGIQMTTVNIYFQQLLYTKIEQQLLMNFSSYLSALGGALGLFAGMSILTFVQCCATFVCLPLQKRGRNSPMESQTATQQRLTPPMPNNYQLYGKHY